MPELEGQKAELTFTVTIKRKETGLEETYPMVGYVNIPPETNEEENHGSYP
jgi:hypothetical protein